MIPFSSLRLSGGRVEEVGLEVIDVTLFCYYAIVAANIVLYSSIGSS